MSEVLCPECGATLEGPYEGRVVCRACGCILIFEGDTVRIVLLGTKTQTRRNHNNAKARVLQKKEAAFNYLHGPSRPYDASPSFSAGRKHTTGTTAFSPPPRRCDSGARQPLRSPIGESSRDTAPSAGGLPAHQMAKRNTSSMPSDEYFLLPRPSSPTIQCPPDCPSKRFCDPSSCALESVREANVIAARLRRVA